MSQNYSDFFSLVYSTLTKNEPTKEILKFLNELCKILVDFEANPIEPPSSCVVAVTANCGASFTQAASAGLNCITDKHFLFSSICDFIEKNHERRPIDVFKEFKNKGLKLPGFGHPSIKGEDDRVLKVIEMAKKLKSNNSKLSFMVILGRQVDADLNIGGAATAALLDMGFDKNGVIYFPLMARMFGWLKIYQELDKEKDPLLPSDVFIEKYKEIFSRR